MTGQDLNQTLKKRRQKKITFTKIILPMVFWGLLAATVYFTNPEGQIVIILFFALLTISLFTTIKLFTASFVFTLTATFLIILALALRYLRLENPLNLTLITLILVLSFVYLKTKQA